jgi:pilus assembly protein CpaB
MRRGRIFFYLAFILILALVAVAVIYFRFIGAPAAPAEFVPTATPVQMTEVVTIVQQVPRGQLLDETVLGTLEIPSAAVNDAYFTSMADVVGRQARFDLDAPTVLTRGMIVESSEQLSTTGSAAALQIPRGMVAVSIPITKVSDFVSYALRPGDHVNVIVSLLFVDLDADFQSILPNNNTVVIAPQPPALETGAGETLTASTGPEGGVQGRAEIDPLLEQTFFIVPSERQRPRLVAQTLLQDAIVLGVGEFALEEEEEQAREQALQPQATPQPEAPEPADEAAPTATPPPIERPGVVTLVVTPQDAVTLNYLVKLVDRGAARLALALRAAEDDTRVQTEAATLDFLLQQYNIPVPVKLPYGTEPRIDEVPQPVAPPQEPQPEAQP